MHCFHTLKDVFVLGRTGKQAKDKANALRTELVNKRKVDEPTNVETWTSSKNQGEKNAWRDYISHMIDVSKELDADQNFLKIHLMSHCVEQLVHMEPFNSILPRDMNKHIKRTSSTVGTCPITISPTCGK